MARHPLRPPIPWLLPQAPSQASAARLLHGKCGRKTRLHPRPRLARPHPRRAIHGITVPLGRNSNDRWDFQGCCHGLAVLVNGRGHEAVVWDPITGQQRRHRLPLSPGPRYGSSIRGTSWFWHAAVMCTDTQHGHVHGDCFSSPFKLVFMCNRLTQAFTCVYNSASGVWGNLISTASTDTVLLRPDVLVGNAVHWLFCGGGVLVFDVETQSLGVIDTPAGAHDTDCDLLSFQLLRTGDDGSLGLAVLSEGSELSIQLWKRQLNSYGVLEWVLLHKTIQLEWLFPRRTLTKEALMVGYDEDSNEIVLASYSGVFMPQIESMKFRTVCKSYSWDNKIFYPYRNFYTAGREVGWKWVNLEL